MNIDVILSPPEIDLLPQADLRETTCVVFDVLRATSSMLTALAHGAGEIHPVRTIEEALALRERFPDALLGGERMGDKIHGFDIGNSPLEYRQLGGKRIITTTTNGTIALRACEKAERVLVGALLNLNALVKELVRLAPEKITIVCAGTFRELALEDVIAAGAVCANLPGAVPGDSARVALSVYKRNENDLMRSLRESRNGLALIAAGRGVDVQWCAQMSIYDTVGQMKAGIITKTGASGMGF
jgi:2-phosphosulfolactate phosphatase